MLRTNAMIKEYGINSELRRTDARVRDATEDASYRIQITEAQEREDAAKKGNKAEAESGAVNGVATGALAIAGACALLGPVGVIIGAVIAVVAAAAMVIEAFRKKGATDDVADINQSADDHKIQAQALDNETKKDSDKISDLADQNRTLSQQMLDNIRAQAESHRPNN
jgi:hypothetical protein